eukprot:CAMPEP_0116846950 /NCGR_PEP_ID=MMETSP0418-20121206/14150_1 /TAXON_ID=1158023 /ORGANISM="Astrosyne radiata, Strain 13vi08-1A" /LENGTH=207 /DNA_ID=CAMNT_0004478315 /DNA_START=24 /DNA_END=647 /DNA_ORIENTATION=-
MVSLQIPIAEISPLDIWMLLGMGFTLEFLSRMLLAWVKNPSKSDIDLSRKLSHLQVETAKKRRLGPSAFVETSKLERQVLALEKEKSASIQRREEETQKLQRVTNTCMYILYLVVFCVYFGKPVLTFDGNAVFLDGGDQLWMLDQKERANAFMQGFLFPISYVGVGMRIARFGLPAPGIGALVVLWSSQATFGKFMDGIDAYLQQQQ